MKTALALSPRKTGFSPLFFSGEIEHGIRTAKELGYDAVELSLRRPDAAETGIILDELRRTDLQVSTIATGQSCMEDGLLFCNEDDGIRDKAVQRLKDLIDFAALVEAKVIIGGIRGRSPRPVEGDLRAKVRDAVQECCEYGARAGVGIILEPVNHYEVSFLHTIAETVEFIGEVGHPALSVLYDTYHVNMEERSIVEPLLIAGRLLGHVHLAENNRLVPGYGCFNFPEVFRALERLDYQGYLCVEALPKPDSLTAARQAMAYLRVHLEKR